MNTYSTLILVFFTCVAVVAALYVIDVLLLIFAAILFAIFLRTLSGWISQQFKLSDRFSVTTVLLILATAIFIKLILLAPVIDEQIIQLTKVVPQAWRNFQEYMQVNLNWKFVPNAIAQSIPQTQVLTTAFNFFSTTFGILGSFGVFLFTGIFLAYNPHPYVKGFLSLIPIAKRPRAKAVLDQLAITLHWWLIGMLCSMSVVGVATFIGLWLLDIPLALTLGLLAGLLTFIPNIGPILSLIPAILIAFGHHPMSALYVAILYLFVQTCESYLITPNIQQRTTSLPPVLIMIAQLLMALLTGVLGLALATPLVAAALVIVRMLYVEDVLKDYSYSSKKRREIESLKQTDS